MEDTNDAREALARPLANSYWVIEARLLGGEHPAAATLTETTQRLKRLRESGIDSFIDLTEPGEQPEYRRLLQRRVQYLRFPIVDTGVPRTIDQMQELLDALRSSLAGGRKVYVHCRAGIGRTGLVMGCFLAERCGNGKEALERLNALWRQSGRAALWPRIPQTSQQTDYILRWPELRCARVAD